MAKVAYWTCHDCRIAIESGCDCWRCGNPERAVVMECDECEWRGFPGDDSKCPDCKAVVSRQPALPASLAHGAAA